MSAWIAIAAAMVTIAAAARSTWSPCGLSMLATLTPLSERSRGHRYRATAAWFVAGAIVGGATLGACSAALAIAFDALSLTANEVLAAALVASLVGVASDCGLGGFHLPVHHRQVNERWLDLYRPWVYGAGFGWQIGTGLTTYIMTAAVYLVVVLGALTGDPWLALGVGTLFGLTRGLAVCLGRRINSSETLSAFHSRFVAVGPKVRRATVATQVATAALFACLLSPWAGVGVASASAAVLAAWGANRRRRRQGARDRQTMAEMESTVWIP